MTHSTLLKASKIVDGEASQFEEIGTRVSYSYFTLSTEVVVAIPCQEATDEELLHLVAKTGAFAFWEDEEEDVYTLEDGTPIE